MRDWEALLSVNESIGPDIFRMEVDCEPIASQAKPGQFVLVSVENESLPLLRPLGISAVWGSRFEMVYRVVGQGTKCLSRKLPGTSLRVRGPAGQGFSKPKEKQVIALAGTLGAAPLLFWRQKFGPFETLLLGVPNGRWTSYARWIARRAPETVFYCDNGEFGHRGFCIEGLKNQELTGRSLVACGPNPMMKALFEQWGQKVDDLQVSLEKRMGCGMGGCFGCVVNLKTGRRRLCVEGPVMQAREVKWDELHL